MRLLLLIVLVFSSFAIAEENTPLNSTFAPSDAELIEQVETFQFNSSSIEASAIELARKLRCPQCQNQNLMESNSPIAKDLRLTVYQMINDGKTEQQVTDFMTSRFGDFVLYQPQFEPKMYLLWFGPTLLLILFGWVGYRRVQKAMG
ncbi:cytochrome c-type biogenesis protein [Aliivibrio kagoshimensis]|uniref:cytochrome c-type biogenesis protein n=1 Tax=Aliivibrio kagoshimensis TaxID=2910230 RepID=UPI003D0FC2CD